MSLYTLNLSTKLISCFFWFDLCTGNYDLIQQPRNIGETARENVRFYMFVDEETEEFMKNDNLLGSDKRVGIWHIIVVRNVPYTDARRNGKVSSLCLESFSCSIFHNWLKYQFQTICALGMLLQRL